MESCVDLQRWNLTILHIYSNVVVLESGVVAYLEILPHRK